MNLSTLSLSFEFFPPKTTEGNKQLYETALLLAKYDPHFFSVTFGAGGSTQVGTVETVNMLLQNTRISVAPHLSCIGSSREDIISVLHLYQSMQVRRIVALRGDLPSGMGSTSELKYANELVALIRNETKNYFHIEVAAYPEIHPQAESAYHDIANLKRKFDAGANGAITQYFFNPDAYFYLVDDCAKQGIHMPIIPGIMPITHYTKLARFSDACGAEIPRWIRKRLESYMDDFESIKQFGMEIVHSLCQQLLVGGAPGLHFYTLNRADEAIAILKNL